MMNKIQRPDLEQMCRNHFNEPLLLCDQVGRLIGYGEDEEDCYLIVRMNNNIHWHTAVGGYIFLNALKGQEQVLSVEGDLWDDYYRLDSLLELNGAKKEAEFILITRNM